jgi:hypothetical protein
VGYSDELLDRFRSGTQRELLDFVCGARIGDGMTREVYRYNPSETLVIKIELETSHYQNISEWQVWDHIKDTKFAKWFAPCHSISECGRFLLMKYAEPIAAIRLPAEVPAFFTDLKPANWGVYNKHPVALDYGKHLMLERGMTSRMRRADWS